MIGRALGRAASGLAAAFATAGLVASLLATGGRAADGAPGRPGDPASDLGGPAAEVEPGPLLASVVAPGVGAGAAPPSASTFAAAATGVLQAGAPASGVAAAPIPVFTVQVVARHPHDAQAFTQGLVWREGSLFESVGREGLSEVRRVDLATGRVLARAAIPADQFGEGLAADGAELVGLTWKHGIAHRWDARTLKRRGGFRYAGEGWGLAGNGRELALSDGTPTLRFMEPRRFAERRRVPLTFGGRPLTDLNELEWIDGALWGNVWHQPVLVRIDPATGRVTALADLRPLVREVAAADPEAVANGIAWDARAKRLFLTGKLWPTLFEVRLVPAS